MSTGPMNTGPTFPPPLGTTGRGPSRFGVQAFLVIAFLFLCGLAGAAIKLWRTAPVAAEVKPPARKFTVVLAAAELDVGREIRASDMYTLSVSADEYRKLIAGQTCFSVAKELVGRIIRNKVTAGAPFSLDCVYPDGTGPTPADLLSDGMRAVTVRMGLVGGLRGMVSPESWVDVMFRRASAAVSPESTTAARTHTLFSGVRVLGIQDSLYPETVLRKDSRGIVADKFEVTLELTPAQCEVLKSVEDRGELSLNMLPREDGRFNNGIVPDSEVMKILLGVDPPQIPVVPAPIPSVRVIRGGSPSSVPVEQVVDTIIDSHLYPAPFDSSTIVPVPQGAKPVDVDDNWPPKTPLLAPKSDSEGLPQAPLPVPQDSTDDSPGASRPSGSTGGSTMVRRSVESDSGVAAARVIPMNPGSIPETRRVFSQANRPVAGRSNSSRSAVSGRTAAGYSTGAVRPATMVQQVRSVPTSRPSVTTRVKVPGATARVLLSAGPVTGGVPAAPFRSPAGSVRSASTYDQRRSVASRAWGAAYPKPLIPTKSTLPGLRVIAGTSGSSGGAVGLSDIKVGRR